MLGIKDFELFVMLSWVLIITPGPDLIYVLTRGVSNGRKAGLMSALGVILGVLVHTILAALGLSVILQTSALAFTIVKYFGAGYLVYLGIKTIFGRKKLAFNANPGNANYWKIFSEGLITNILNPKVALFFIAFLPQFIANTGQKTSAIQFLLLGIIFALFGAIFLSTLGYFSGYMSRFLLKNNKIAERFQIISGLILFLLGIRLAFVKQK